MFIRVVLLVAFLFSVTAHSKDRVDNDSTKFIEGKHYKVLQNPLPKGIAPVVEFFYFGCKSCYQLTPEIAEWSRKAQIDISLIPAHTDKTMVDEARMFHTFDEMGELVKMYELGYVIFQTTSSNLQGADRVNHYLDQHKLDKTKFWSLWDSDVVNQRLKSSAMLTRQAQISKTPTFVVHGTYKIDVESLKSVEELFELLSFLIDKKPKSAPALLKKPN